MCVTHAHDVCIIAKTEHALNVWLSIILNLFWIFEKVGVCVFSIVLPCLTVTAITSQYGTICRLCTNPETLDVSKRQRVAPPPLGGTLYSLGILLCQFLGVQLLTVPMYPVFLPLVFSIAVQILNLPASASTITSNSDRTVH